MSGESDENFEGVMKFSPDEKNPRYFITQPKLLPDFFYSRPKLLPEILYPNQNLNLDFLHPKLQKLEL